ncbi:hypothetical protein [Spirosoma linguale]|uniref:Uncharacterized protein n=1 Tax=Spirosoma linguale (strain ATCC 33905 / DSM 74 / LMG 10896 / Claus 1) TaxID=504472 RepID=D2QCP6_SPILD|nr:hypothetical protein Slin_2006 [Spirosoma linguale DSM 74]
MKPLVSAITLLILLGRVSSGQAQSTTGGRSGGSTASTGTGYLTEGKRTAASNPSSMTIADEGASRAYMYVPPTNAKNRSASPDGSGGGTKPQSKTPVNTNRKVSPKKAN